MTTETQEKFVRFRRLLPGFALAIAVLYGIALAIGNTAIAGFAWVILTILLALLTLAIGAMAGAAVVKALFAVAAELSLLIFLAQTFCAAPGRMSDNDRAMAILFTVGMAYIAYLFLTTLGERLRDIYKRRFEDRPRSWDRALTITAFAAFVLLFLWELYLIVYPIVRGLCVYR